MSFEEVTIGQCRLIRGDALDVLPTLADNSLDACVTDPPYGLGFMGKEFDTLGDGLAQQVWHGRWAAAVYRALKPGACLVAFGGTRTHHRLMCADCREWELWLFQQRVRMDKATSTPPVKEQGSVPC